MANASTPTFVTTIPLKIDSYTQAVLKKRFFAAQQQYNALLGEAVKRLRLMRADSRYKEAWAIYKQEGEKEAAKALFKKLEQEYGYREYDLHAYTKQWNKKGSSLSIGANISQRLATRVFNAVKQYAIGKRGKPRFKQKNRLNSIEDKSIKGNIRLKARTVCYLGLKLPLMYTPADKVHCHGLNAPVKYVRIVKKSYSGRIRYAAQLVCEGKPYIKAKNKLKEGVIGLDVGPQTIAMVSPEKQYAALRVFADELKTHKKKKKRLQRKLARQLRANNPHAYEKDVWAQKDKCWYRKKGKNIKGQRLKNRSKSLLKTQHQLADMARKQATHRKTLHGRLVNTILKIGNQIKTEKLSYKSFQKNFGKSVGLRAPGMFIEKLKCKAENAGGHMEEINTYKTKLSQACQCGRYARKKLSNRWHQCACGVAAQRDLYSAYLACFVQNDKLIADQAQKAWSGTETALRTAMRTIKHSSRGPLPSSLGI